jgi:hypothetical protein
MLVLIVVLIFAGVMVIMIKLYFLQFFDFFHRSFVFPPNNPVTYSIDSIGLQMVLPGFHSRLRVVNYTQHLIYPLPPDTMKCPQCISRGRTSETAW